ILSAWKRRRDDEVPSRAPTGSADNAEPSRVTRISAVFSRTGTAATRNCGGRTAGRSFIEWTAASIVRAASACSSSLMKSPLPPACASDADLSLSPLVRISTISMSASTPEICAASRSRIIDAWTSASLLGREPILILSLGLSAIGNQRAAPSLGARVVIVVRVIEAVVMRVGFSTQQAAGDLGGERGIERFVVVMLEAGQNAMKQFVGQSVSEQFDSVAHRGFELRQPSAMPSHLDVAQPFDTVADVLDGGGQVETREPLEERLEFELDDLFGLFGFALAIAERSFNQRAEIVDVVQIDVLQRVQPLVEIARHAHVDQKHRPVAAFANHGLEFVGTQHRFGGCDRTDKHVHHLEVRLVVVERHRG